MSTDLPDGELLRLTANIVSAHLSKNTTPADGVSELIRSVYAALGQAGTPDAVPEVRQPAVPIRKSIFPDYIVCLEDGKKLTMLKRYLMTTYSMTPDAYREKWNLPSDYPMVAPNYTKRRSALAKELGLGRKPEPVEEAPLPAPDPVPSPAPVVVEAVAEAPVIDGVVVQRIPARKRGRKPKAAEAVEAAAE